MARISGPISSKACVRAAAVRSWPDPSFSLLEILDQPYHHRFTITVDRHVAHVSRQLLWANVNTDQVPHRRHGTGGVHIKVGGAKFGTHGKDHPPHR